MKERPITKVTKPGVLVVTNRVAEGEPIPPLPSWIEGGYTKRDIIIRQARLNDMFNSDYVNNNVDDSKPSDRNQEWLNVDKNLNL